MFSRKRAHLVIVSFLCLVVTGCNYGDTMRKAFKSAFGSDFSEYQFVSYPTDNFGIGTSYLGSSDPKNFQCATWSCFGITQDAVAALASAHPDKIADINGYADVGKGGSLTLSTDDQKNISLGAVVPSIYNMLGVTANADWTKHVKTTLLMPQGHIRFINADNFATYMKSLPDDNPRKKALKDGTLIVVWSDLVADSMTVTIDVDTTAEADLEAKLSSALAGKVGTVIGQGADLTFKVNAAGSGHYELQTVFPVVAAVLAAKPPLDHGKLLPQNIEAPDFKKWNRVKLSRDALQSPPKTPAQ
jgi:hypothetical protein